MNRPRLLTADTLRHIGLTLGRTGDAEAVVWLLVVPIVVGTCQAMRDRATDRAELREAFANGLLTAGFPAAGVEPLWQALEAIAEARS